MGTGLEHFLRSHWFTANCFLIRRVLSVLVESQGTRFAETRAAIMNNPKSTKGGARQIWERAFSLALLGRTLTLGHTLTLHWFVPS